MAITIRIALAGDLESIRLIYNEGIVDRIATLETENFPRQSTGARLISGLWVS